MAKYTGITVEQLRARISYCPESGVFTWKHRDASFLTDDEAMTASQRAAAWNKRHAGKIAGAIVMGYRQIALCGKKYWAHRIAWALYYGEWPQAEVDHINRDKSDNRVANLRLATSSQNKFNQKIRKNSKTGIKGVSWCAARAKYRAVAGFNRKYVQIGYFDRIEDAAVAYEKFAADNFKEFANPERRYS